MFCILLSCPLCPYKTWQKKEVKPCEDTAHSDKTAFETGFFFVASAFLNKAANKGLIYNLRSSILKICFCLEPLGQDFSFRLSVVCISNTSSRFLLSLLHWENTSICECFSGSCWNNKNSRYEQSCCTDTEMCSILSEN